MIKNAHPLQVVKAVLATPQIALAKPSVNWFFYRYLQKFKVKEIGGNLIIHSHLPPMNSRPYSRFIKEHLLAKSIAPSHAQIAITNACPQHCEYCYNRNRTGQVMDKVTILQTVRDLQELGVFWLGLTGGEPLLNKHIVEIVATAAERCAVKLFTTGCTLTKELAMDLKQAGLFSVSVSLDHTQEALHDQIRNYKGAFRTALNAISTFKNVDGLHVGVSAVLSKEMLKQDKVEEFLQFLQGLDIHEAWLSETKPSVAAFQRQEFIVTQEERARLIQLQDQYSQQGKMTVNFLGHFEDERHFGCTAGHKMIYIDAFGEVSPCVFIPMSFGNIRENSLAEIYQTMLQRFPSEKSCFMNKNYTTLLNHSKGSYPIDKGESIKLMDEIKFGPLAKFFSLQYQ